MKAKANTNLKVAIFMLETLLMESEFILIVLKYFVFPLKRFHGQGVLYMITGGKVHGEWENGNLIKVN